MARAHWWGLDTGNVGDWGTAANWSPSGVPGAGDEIIIGPEAAGQSVDIHGTLDQSGVALGDIWILEGYIGQIGLHGTGNSTPVNLQIDCTRLHVAGTGKMYISLEHTGAIDVIVEAAEANPLIGESGLYVTTDGTGTIGILSVLSGFVSLAHFADDPSQTCAEAICNGPQAHLEIGEPVTATAVTVENGVCRWLSGNTTGTFTVSGGVANLLGSGAITAAVAAGGLMNLGGIGTISTLTMDGGTVNGCYLATTQTISSLLFSGPGTYHGNASYRTLTAINDRTDNVAYTIESRVKQ